MPVHIYQALICSCKKRILFVLFPRGKCQRVLLSSCCLGLWTVHDKGTGENHGAHGSNWDRKPHPYVKFCLSVFCIFMISRTGDVYWALKPVSHNCRHINFSVYLSDWSFIQLLLPLILDDIISYELHLYLFWFLQDWNRTWWKSQKAMLKKAQVAVDFQLFLQVPHFSVVQHRVPATTKALKPELKACIFRNEGEQPYSDFLSETSLVVEGLLVLNCIVI